MAIVIQWQNISSVLSDAQCAVIMAAVQAQSAQDVAPYWGIQSVSFTHVPKGTSMNPHQWQFVIADTSDQAGAAGYHETTSGGEPIGYAFAKTTQEAGMNPSVTISHEALEMLGDALIDQSNQWADNPSAVFLAQELCDPVEDDSLGYMKNGVLVSDFVTPAYFISGSVGPWDFMKHLKAPNSLAVGGYQSLWTPKHGWTENFADGEAKGRAALVSRHSRSKRRMVPVGNRKRSLV